MAFISKAKCGFPILLYVDKIFKCFLVLTGCTAATERHDSSVMF